jgi:nicotinamidase-related amidase
MQSEAPMKTCLLVIDVQESFRQRAYFKESEAAAYLQFQNALIAGCEERGIAIVRVLHADGSAAADDPFALESGHVVPMRGLRAFVPAASFYKRRYSALVGTGLDVWLTEQGIGRLIISGMRAEQCCETTARHACDLGWRIDYVNDATHTFDLEQTDGSPLRVADIKSHTAAVLNGRFATLCTVEQALARAA